MATIIYVKQPRSIGQAFGEGLQAGMQQGLDYASKKLQQEMDYAFKKSLQEQVLAAKEGSPKELERIAYARFHQAEIDKLPPAERGKAGPADLPDDVLKRTELNARIYARGDADVQNDLLKHYGIVGVGGEEDFTSAEGTKRVGEMLLRESPRNLRPGYVEQDAEGKSKLTVKGKEWSEGWGALIAGKKGRPEDAMKEVQLTEQERAVKFLSATAGLRKALLEAPDDIEQLPEGHAKQVEQFAGDIREYAGAAEIRGAATTPGDDPVQRILRGESVVSPGVDKQLKKMTEHYIRGSAVEGDKIAATLIAKGYQNEVSAIQEKHLASALAEHRAVSAEGRAETTAGLAEEAAGRAKAEHDARMQEFREGKKQNFVDALSGKPIGAGALTPVELNAAVKDQPLTVPIPLETWQKLGTERLTVFVPEVWANNPTTVLSQSDIRVYPLLAATEGHPSYDEVKRLKLDPLDTVEAKLSFQLRQQQAAKPTDRAEREQTLVQAWIDLHPKLWNKSSSPKDAAGRTNLGWAKALSPLRGESPEFADKSVETWANSVTPAASKFDDPQYNKARDTFNLLAQQAHEKLGDALANSGKPMPDLDKARRELRLELEQWRATLVDGNTPSSWEADNRAKYGGADELAARVAAKFGVAVPKPAEEPASAAQKGVPNTPMGKVVQIVTSELGREPNLIELSARLLEEARKRNPAATQQAVDAMIQEYLKAYPDSHGVGLK